MNQFLNPVFMLRLAWHYARDVNRVWRLDKSELERYQNKMFKKLVRYAYKKTKLYREKFGEANLDVEEIRSIKDIEKIPLINKEDLAGRPLEEIAPQSYLKKEFRMVSTSGSSGKPVSLPYTLYETALSALYGLRMMRAYGLNWRKTRVTNIGDFSVSRSSDEELYKPLIHKVSSIGLAEKQQLLYVGEKGEDLIRKMERFRPDLIVGYTSVLVSIALLRKEGFGENIKPKYIVSSGEILDRYSRKIIEDAFDTKVLDLYATTEGGAIAFECLEGNMHVNTDLIYMEILDDKGNRVKEGKVGNIVITKLLPMGVPIIRYTGLNDMASMETRDCGCGMRTPLIKKLEGRRKEAIILPNNRIIPPATIPLPLIESMEKFNVDNVERFQFFQDRSDRLEIRLKVRGKLKNEEKLFEDIIKGYKKMFGEEVDIEVRVVDELENPEKSLLPPSVISKISSLQ